MDYIKFPVKADGEFVYITRTNPADASTQKTHSRAEVDLLVSKGTVGENDLKELKGSYLDGEIAKAVKGADNAGVVLKIKALEDRSVRPLIGLAAGENAADRKVLDDLSAEITDLRKQLQG